MAWLGEIKILNDVKKVQSHESKWKKKITSKTIDEGKRQQASRNRR